MDDEVCTCGHVFDEHEDTFLQPCTVCDCAAFEAAEEDRP